MNALEIIKDAAILKNNDWQALAEIKGELRRTWETVQVFRTPTEMKLSVLKDIQHPTPDSKYWQAVREQNVMFGELVELSYAYRKKTVEIKKLRRDIVTEQDELEKELKQIEIEQNEWHLRNMERVAHDRIRETLEWSAIKKELLPHMKHGVNDVNEHQLEAMQKRFQAEQRLVNAQTPIADARNIIGLAEMANKAALAHAKIGLVK